MEMDHIGWLFEADCGNYFEIDENRNRSWFFAVSNGQKMIKRNKNIKWQLFGSSCWLFPAFESGPHKISNNLGRSIYVFHLVTG